MIIKRTIQKSIENGLFKGKIIILYGARQVGKTTLVKEIQKNYPDNSIYLNCDEPDIRAALTDKTSTELKSFFGHKKLVILDEAQQVKNIGHTLKLAFDNFPEVQILATGSSSFELSDKISEPLTGRKIEFFLYPFSFEEVASVYSDLEMDRFLEKRMIYGMYPEVVVTKDNVDINLKNLARSYSYKDVLKYQNIKNPELLEKLLQALALQIGNEVSYNELSNLLGVDKKTIASYMQILEKAFIIFRIGPFSRNLRSELKRLRKIYFYDTGIRNALINNLNPLNLRQDVGGIWENFIIAERKKFLNNNGFDRQAYFWRTLQKQEIDYIEEYDGIMSAFEIKWKTGKMHVPKAFSIAYPKTKVKLINLDNYKSFIG